MTEKQIKQRNCKPHEWCECDGPGKWACHKCQKKRPIGFMSDLRWQIEDCLFKFPDTRNDDIALTRMIWITHWGQYVQLISGSYMVKLDDLYQIPREDHIKRIRAKIQNEEFKFLPTSWEVAKGRGIAEDKWRAIMGYAAVKPEPLPVGEQRKLL